MSARVGTLFLFAAVLGGCGGGGGVSGAAFSTDWSNDGGKSIADLQRRLAGEKPPTGTPMAVGITPAGMVAVGLNGSGAWKYKGDLDARPTITGDVVVATGGGQLYALNAKTGQKLWSVSSDGKSLRGAGDDGKFTLASLGTVRGGGGLLVAVNRAGEVTLRTETEPEIGTPAVLGGTGFVPWGNQYVSAIDLASGEETARLLMREQVTHAVNLGGTLYFGERRVAPFNAKIGELASGSGTLLGLPERELPGKPEWLGAGTRVVSRQAGARDKIRLYARPAEAGFDSNRFAATYFRVAMGFDSQEGSLSWVRFMKSAVLGGDGFPGGFALCQRNGTVTLLGASQGTAVGKAELGEPVQACVVQGAAFTAGAGKGASPLAEQVTRALTTRAPQMVTAQRFLLRELALLEGGQVTGALIRLASNPRTPPMLIEDARKTLASRRDGAKAMMAALDRHYDYLEDITLAPPVGPMADALAAMNATEAAPALASHLADPADTPDDVLRAARALEKLASADELPELLTFFALYRATAPDEALVNAVIAVARAIVRVGDEADHQRLRDAASDPQTKPALATVLANLVPKKAPAKKPAPKSSGKKKGS